MGTKTGMIRFNVKERGRRHRGVDRNFDTAALASLVNGPEVQERVKNGDLVGYYGHWPRVKFGLDVQEAAVVGGRVVNLEPAIRTVSIKGYANGDIDHEVEFLNTAPGRLAERMWRAKAGGFSSAINAPRRGSMQVPQSFHGFDFVLEPNFTANRGYAMDSAGNRMDLDGLSDDEALVLDEVEQYNALMDSTTTMLDRMQTDYDRQSEVLLVIQQENVEYQSEIAKLQAALDSVKGELAHAKAAPPPLPAAAPAPAAAEPEQQMTRQEILDSVRQSAVLPGQSRYAAADSFHSAKLAGFEPVDGEVKRKPEPTDDYMNRRFGIR